MFNLSVDPYEKDDLASARPVKRDEMVAALQAERAKDSERPLLSCWITAPERIRKGKSTTVTIEFSEPVQGFTRDDLDVFGAKVDDFSGKGDRYEAMLTPAKTPVDRIRVSFSAGKAAAVKDASRTNDRSSEIVISIVNCWANFKSPHGTKRRLVCHEVPRKSLKNR